MAATKNIYQKMAAVTASLKTVGKNLEVSAGRSGSYKAVSERDILDAVKPAEEKEGIYSYPADRELIEARIIERENGNPIFFTRYRTVYNFVNADNPEEKVQMTVYSEGIDTGDKGAGKAMTYADKYALMKAYKISTGEDPDQTASPEEPEQVRPAKRQTEKKTAYEGPKEVTPASGTITDDQVMNLEKLIRDTGTSRDNLIAWVQKTWKKSELDELSVPEYAALFETLSGRKKKEEAPNE